MAEVTEPDQPTEAQPDTIVADPQPKEYYLDPEGGYPDPEVGR